MRNSIEIFYLKIKNFIKDLVAKNTILALILRFSLKKKLWIQSSLWNYSLFFLAGTVWLAIIRFFQIWITGTWEYINLYYSTTAVSCLVSLFAIFLKYLSLNGYLERSKRNSEKWANYESLVCAKHQLGANFSFNKAGYFLFFLLGFSFWLSGNYKNFVSGCFMSFVSLLLLLYFMNYLYIVYCMVKTPVPLECFLEPPSFLVKIVGIVPQIDQSRRNYGTNTKFQRSQAIFTQNKQFFWPLLKATGLLIGSAVSADLGIAAMENETAYSTRSLDKARYGWITNSPKARERAIFLINEMGEDPNSFVGSDKRLDIQKVYSTYNKHKANNFEKT